MTSKFGLDWCSHGAPKVSCIRCQIPARPDHQWVSRDLPGFRCKCGYFATTRSQVEAHDSLARGIADVEAGRVRPGPQSSGRGPLIPTPAPNEREANVASEGEDTGDDLLDPAATWWDNQFGPDKKPDKRARLLLDATTIVTADRNNAYGPPEDNFKRIAELWTTFLQQRGLLSMGSCIEVEDVATLMILMKVARLIASPDHRDSWQDIAGYAACGWSTVA